MSFFDLFVYIAAGLTGWWLGGMYCRRRVRHQTFTRAIKIAREKWNADEPAHKIADAIEAERDSRTRPQE